MKYYENMLDIKKLNNIVKEGNENYLNAMYYYTAGDTGGQKSKEHSTIFISENGKEDELGKQSIVRRIKNKVKKIILG